MAGLRARKATTVAVLVGVLAVMGGLVASAVPLYRLFCQVTGFGGTTQVADTGPEAVYDRVVTVRFNADVGNAMPWRFAPAQRAVDVKVGEVGMARFTAENPTARAVTGRATYNVTPYKAGPYFSKVACFCFTEQTLAPGERVDMPVSFFVDPAILDDPNLDEVTTITLSYTFFAADDDAGPVAESRPSAEAPAVN